MTERRLAAEVVAHVLKARAALDDTLDMALASGILDARDSGLARAIATATFRHLGSLRRALTERFEKGMPSNSGPLDAILLTAAAQILDLDVPDHAVVDLAVDLTREDNRSAPYGKLANAVLRRIARERDAILAARNPLTDDTPEWLAARWRATYGDEIAQAIALANGREAGLDLTLKDINEADSWSQMLVAQRLPTGSLRLADRSGVRDLPGYEQGAWWVQDAAAALPAHLLNVQQGERVVDLCAAPGGKTAQLAARGASVLAVDRSEPRLVRLRQNMERLGLVVETRAADALTLSDDPFDAVLLDAPCSATGTLRRHPDVAWTKKPEDVARLADLQRRLLVKAVELTRPGGRIVYCTCSLEPEEGEEQIAALLASRSDVVRDAILPEEVPGLEDAISSDGDLRLLPSLWPNEHARLAGVDGFFTARLVKKS
jgi:16S rRNA (cytosine967-C5)-methyltransferase